MNRLEDPKNVSLVTPSYLPPQGMMGTVEMEF